MPTPRAPTPSSRRRPRGATRPAGAALLAAALLAACDAPGAAGPTGARAAAATCTAPADVAGTYKGDLFGAVGVMVPISVGLDITMTLARKPRSRDGVVVTGGKLTGNILGTSVTVPVTPGSGEVVCGAFSIAFTDASKAFNGRMTGSVAAGKPAKITGTWRGLMVGGDRADEPAGWGRGTFKLTRQGP